MISLKEKEKNEEVNVLTKLFVFKETLLIPNEAKNYTF